MHKEESTVLKFRNYMSGDTVLRRVFKYIVDENTRIFEIKFSDASDKGEIVFEMGNELVFVKFTDMNAHVEYYDLDTKNRHKCKSILDEVEEIMDRPGYQHIKSGLIKVFYKKI